MKAWTKTGTLLLATVILSIFIETALRLFGALDFPLYIKSENIGYYLSPEQSGVYLRRNSWFVNREGLNNDKPFSGSKPYTLLVGDSVVYGGNPIDYKSRIGYILSNKVTQNIWVAAVGGWSLSNELSYISKLGEISNKAKNIIIQYDNGDLEGPAHWGGELIHPTHKPILATEFLFKKYVLPKLGISIGSDLPPIPSASASAKSNIWITELDGLLDSYKGKILFVLYPDQSSLSNPSLWNAQTTDIRKYISTHSSRIDVIDVSKLPEWNSSLYRDGIHPNIEGNHVLASEISKWINLNK